MPKVADKVKTQKVIYLYNRHDGHVNRTFPIGNQWVTMEMTLQWEILFPYEQASERSIVR